MVATKAIVQVADLAAEQRYIDRRDPAIVAAVELGGIRTFVAVPMLKENELIGALIVYRQEVRPFTDKQIALVTNFAAQAVIAIENARLLNELRQRTTDLTERTDDLTEALEQQTATSEVLQVISSSPGDLDPVFATLLENATRICDAKFGNVYLWDGDAFRLVAAHNTPSAFVESRKRAPFRPNREHPFRSLIETKQVFHVADLAALPGYREGDPQIVEPVKLGGIRTCLGVPMLKDNNLIGALVIFRQEVRLFADKQIELITSFAAQAVIAIENTRLLNELRQRTTDLTERTADLTESLERQTATSEVLQVISSSPGDLQPVFEAMLEKAVRICDAKFGNIYRWDGELLHLLAAHNTPPALAEVRRQSAFRPSSLVQRMVETKSAAQVLDLAADESYTDKHPASVTAVELGGVRTILSVPLVKKNELIGSFSLYRQEVRPFTAKQIELVENFSKQAVIAIENARLLNELRESLQQQTATADVLKVISRSTFDLPTVLNTLVESAARLCRAEKAQILVPSENVHRFYSAASYGHTPEYNEHLRNVTFAPGREGVVGRVLLERRPVQIADVLADPDYRLREVQRLGGFRTHLGLPMLRQADLIGILLVSRDTVQPFADQQIELLTTFADQAVIAIENVRLFEAEQQRTRELTESLEQQTATSEVLQVISSSPGDLQPVFEAMLENAVRICDAKFGNIYRFDGDTLRVVAAHGTPAAFLTDRQGSAIVVSGTSVTARMARTKAVIHVEDLIADPAYVDRNPTTVAAVELGGVRTYLAVPMLKDNELIGGFALSRQEVRPFSGKQVALVTSFVNQAVIAIENTRLLTELRQRTGDLTESLEQQTATSKVLDVISRSAFDLRAVFEAVVESSVRLCGAERGFIYRFDGEVFRMASSYNASPQLVEWIEHHPFRAGTDSASARAALEHRTIHIPDVYADPDYTYGSKFIESFHTVLSVPVLKGDMLLGIITIYHLEVRPFTDKQIALVETFADQAAIAIENARLLDALHHRTDELGRSVSELRALGEVSQAVNSTLDLETVLTTIVSRAVQLSRTDAGAIYVFDDERQEFRLHATYGMSETMIAAISDQRIGLGDAIGAATAQRKPIQVPDIRNEPTSPVNEIIVREGYRGILIIPLLRPDHIVGALVVRRKTPGEFANSTIDLLQTFADQSVVAIQNARLFESVEARTRELAKSLGDLRTAQDRLVQTQKLASLGQLTAGIAHEIKNPLNFVNNFSGVSAELMDELREAVDRMTGDDRTRAEVTELADTLRDNLDKIVQHGKRADSIVKNMLLHSREGSGEHRPVEVNALVEESFNLAYHGARAENQSFKINMERSLDPATGKIDVFPQEITRALLNLISNGFYAATKRKEQNDSEGYEPTLAASTKSLGDRVEIRIRDNGTGIPPDVKEKIFNPFFTTKPAGEGTGLGLSICHDIIVKQHSGSIEVDSQPGEYTEVRIVLPRAAVR
jgi:GAF domain-containing protein